MTSFRSAMACLLLLLAAPLAAQTRDELVRSDREKVEADDSWIYSDLELGKRLAGSEGKPLLVIFRCIPCEACAMLDEQVLHRQAGLRELMDRFICVRIPKGNAMDLTQFQHDYDLSFAAYFMHPDGTIYGRYGTRSSREEADRDISPEGFAAALQAALRLHAAYPTNRNYLAGKQAREVKVSRPEAYPSLKGKYASELDFGGATAKSCLHCHQIREAQRKQVRDEGLAWDPKILYPYPTPDLLGLRLDPQTRATIAAVAPDSIAAAAGLAPGDSILTLDGQAILSTADVQWVLHHTVGQAGLPVVVRRDGETRRLELELPARWREASDISWRVTTWDLRRMATGGMVLEPLSDAQRVALNLPADSMALRAKHVGQYGEHAVAKRAGLKKGDVIVKFHTWSEPLNETQLIARTLQTTQPGDEIRLVYLRDGQRRETTFKTQ